MYATLAAGVTWPGAALYRTMSADRTTLLAGGRTNSLGMMKSNRQSAAGWPRRRSDEEHIKHGRPEPTYIDVLCSISLRPIIQAYDNPS